jgi:thioesterase domain-containing protein
MLAAVGESEGADLPFLQFLAEGTVEAIASEIEAWRKDRRECSGLVPIQPGGSRRPLCVVPGHDGVLVGISRLARLLGEAQPVWAFTLAGQEGAGSVGELARRFVALLRQQVPRGPYRLAGVCFGGLVAYEMARRLESEGEHVELLAIIDSLNPAWWRTQSVRGLAGALWRQWRIKAAHHRAALRGLDAGASARYVGRRLAGMTAHHAETLAARLEHAGLPWPRAARRARRAYRRQMLAYVPGRYGGRVLLVKVSGRRLDAPLLGWQGAALGAIEEVEIPRRFGGALSGDNAWRVAAILAARLG